MKNGLIIWNVILSIVAGYLVIVHFGSKKKTTKGGTISHNDTASANGPFRLAYFEMDSVAASFEMVKELRTELTKKENEINAEMDRLTKNIQQRYNYFQSQAQAGKLSQEESEAASQELKTLDDQMKNRRAQLDQEYNELNLRKQNDIKSKIKEFIKEYNKSRNYTYIVSDDPGLFYYQDTVYNLTKDVVKGLNEMYKVKK